MMNADRWFPKISAILFVFLLFWHNVDGTIVFSFDNQTAPPEIKLKFGTPVLLRFVNKITSENFKVGQVVDLEVSANVYKDGVVVIPEGLPAKGMIISSSGKHYAGEGGNLAVGNFYLFLNNSQRINLDGILRLEGEDKKESLVIGQCCFFGYLIKGKEAFINEGQTFRAILSRDEVIRRVDHPQKE